MTSVCDAHTGALAEYYGPLLQRCDARTADLNEKMKVLEKREEAVRHSELLVAQNPDLMGEVDRLTSIVTEQQRKIKTLEQQLISETGNSSPEQNHEPALNERIDTLNTEVAQLRELLAVQEDHQRKAEIQEGSEDSAVKSKDALTQKLNKLGEENKELSKQLEVHRAKIQELSDVAIQPDCRD
jgi:chromosome segregation ATPase